MHGSIAIASKMCTQRKKQNLKTIADFTTVMEKMNNAQKVERTQFQQTFCKLFHLGKSTR